MTEKFCKLLSNAISFRVPGNANVLTFNPCCLYDEYIPFHPTTFKKSREKFIQANDFLPECNKCKLKEKTHGTSLRINSNKLIPNNINNDIHKLEISIDTTCNAACIQCGELQSSLWRKEFNKNIIHIQPKNQIDDKILLIKKNIDLKKVKHFHFWGGEPFLTDTHLKILSEVSDYRNTSLVYTTNGSIFPNDNILKFLEKFKQVKIHLSLDGINEKFHYIRWPLTWEKITENLSLFKNNIPSNTTLQVNYCVIPLNAFYIDEFEEFLYKSFDKTIYGKPIILTIIKGEGTLDIAKTPFKLREEVWKKLPDNHIVSNILKETSIINHDTMISYIDHWDSVRKLNWKNTFHNIADYFNI